MYNAPHKWVGISLGTNSVHTKKISFFLIVAIIEEYTT